VRTYNVFVNITLSIDEQIVERAREKLRATGKSVNDEIRDHLRHVAGEDDLESARVKETPAAGSGIGTSFMKSAFSGRGKRPHRQAHEN